MPITCLSRLEGSDLMQCTSNEVVSIPALPGPARLGAALPVRGVGALAEPFKVSSSLASTVAWQV